MQKGSTFLKTTVLMAAEIKAYYLRFQEYQGTKVAAVRCSCPTPTMGNILLCIYHIHTTAS